MTDRLVIEITADLPEDGKFAVLAAAEEGATRLGHELNEVHSLETTVSVRAVRPGRKSGAAVLLPKAAE